MAVSYMSPLVPVDEVSLSEALVLFQETGHPWKSMDTFVRHCRKRGVPLERRGKHNYGSWTDLLKVHRDWVQSKN
jgi:hypothetical protein